MNHRKWIRGQHSAALASDASAALFSISSREFCCRTQYRYFGVIFVHQESESRKRHYSYHKNWHRWFVEVESSPITTQQGCCVGLISTPVNHPYQLWLLTTTARKGGRVRDVGGGDGGDCAGGGVGVGADCRDDRDVDVGNHEFPTGHPRRRVSLG